MKAEQKRQNGIIKITITGLCIKKERSYYYPTYKNNEEGIYLSEKEKKTIRQAQRILKDGRLNEENGIERLYEGTKITITGTERDNAILTIKYY